MEKVSLITGDCTLPELGISKESRELLKQSVEIVIHSAATVRFTEPIRFALAINVRGTKEIAKLSKEMTKLEVSLDFIKYSYKCISVSSSTPSDMSIAIKF